MRVSQPPSSLPWDPRDLLQPDQRSGLNGLLVAWDELYAVLTIEIPGAFHDLLTDATT